MTTLVAVHGVVPPHRYPQAELTAAFAELCLPDPTRRGVLERVHGNAGVQFRHLARPIEAYAGLADVRSANEVWIEVASELGEQAVKGALAVAGIAPGEVDLIISTTITGVAVPSIEARIAGRLGLRSDVVRIPLFGLGCVAGAAGVARLHDHLTGHPDQVAVLLSVELCSLTVQRDDPSMANAVASGLFGDGAAAVVAVGAERAAAMGAGGPRVISSRSHLYPDTMRTMGWDVIPSGLKIVLDAGVPELVEKYLGPDVREFLADNGFTVDDVSAWVSHPGGPKVISAIETTLDLPDDALQPTWDSLARVGNLSSASVLHVLADIERERRPAPGEIGVMMALGPGFCSELVLLQW
ncbi:MAG: 3-oxoacyl-[acyl-carrier-protein] synthase III C-terminal domain-containing protein [Nakamurella sp.]